MAIIINPHAFAGGAPGPVNLTIEPVYANFGNDSHAFVSWTNLSNTGYQLEYSTNNSTWTTVNLDTNVTTYTVSNILTDGQTRYFRVRANQSGVYTQWSNKSFIGLNTYYYYISDLYAYSNQWSSYMYDVSSYESHFELQYVYPYYSNWTPWITVASASPSGQSWSSYTAQNIGSSSALLPFTMGEEGDELTMRCRPINTTTGAKGPWYDSFSYVPIPTPSVVTASRTASTLSVTFTNMSGRNAYFAYVYFYKLVSGDWVYQGLSSQLGNYSPGQNVTLSISGSFASGTYIAQCTMRYSLNSGNTADPTTVYYFTS